MRGIPTSKLWAPLNYNILEIHPLTKLCASFTSLVTPCSTTDECHIDGQHNESARPNTNMSIEQRPINDGSSSLNSTIEENSSTSPQGGGDKRKRHSAKKQSYV